MSVLKNDMIDQTDWSQYRHHRDKIVGHTYKDEYYQEMPFFFTAEGNSVPIRGNYRGASCFFIASGGSFAALDKEPLKYVNTFCVNNSPAACLPVFTPDMWCCVDTPASFIKEIWMSPKITKFVPHGMTEKFLWDNERAQPLRNGHPDKLVKVRECPNILYFHRNEHWKPEQYLFENTVNWGNHSKLRDKAGVKGKRSVMHAAIKIMFILGFRTIYLLGVDFYMNRRNKYSFPQERSKSSMHGNNSTYATMNRRWKDAKPYMDQEGLKVFNCNPKSRLEVFDHVPYETAIKDALAYEEKAVDGVSKPVTLGLYDSRWVQCPLCQAHNRVMGEDYKKAGKKCTGADCGYVFRKRDKRKHGVKG